MADMFCPQCGGIVIHHTGVVAEFGPRRSMSISYDPLVACTSCPMVSAVTPAGVLVDLGMLTMADLEVPYVKTTDDGLPLVMQRPAGVMRRRDS